MYLRLRQIVLLVQCSRNRSTEWHVPGLELLTQCFGDKRSYVRYYRSFQVYLKPMMLQVYVFQMSCSVSFSFWLHHYLFPLVQFGRGSSTRNYLSPHSITLFCLEPPLKFNSHHGQSSSIISRQSGRCRETNCGTLDKSRQRNLSLKIYSLISFECRPLCIIFIFSVYSAR